MHMESFHARCPDIAEKETRCVVLPEANEFGLPPGSYSLMESYCNDPSCDCRTVFLNFFP